MSAIRPLDPPDTFLVQSSRDPEEWFVADVSDSTCSCPFGETRPDGVPSTCKHIRRALALHRLLSFHQSTT